MIKKYFINLNEKRLRSGWRLLLFLISIPLLLKPLAFLVKRIFGDLNNINAINWFSRGLLVVIGVSVLVLLFRKYIDRKSFASLGLHLDRLAWFDLLVGFILSALMAGLFFLTLYALGYLEINTIKWESNEINSSLEFLLLFFGIGIATGYSEELGFRGYILQNLGEGIGLKWAIAVSCVIYGVVHISNPHSSILSSLIIMGFGFLRIFGWLCSGQLWLSIGMHAGWNFFQGPIFGFSASGKKSNRLINHTVNGPEWITGGDFGPEGSIIIVPILFIATLCMYFWTKKRKQVPLRNL